MHYLITGGSGFIGAALSAELIREGHAVTVLSRDPERVRKQLPVDVRIVSSLIDERDVQAVVNLAGENLGDGRWTAARKSAFLASRIDATRALIAWMHSSITPPKLLISASAIGYYGPHGDEPLNEDSPPGTDFAADLCRAWEDEALKAEIFGVRVCRLRIGVVLGRGGGALSKMLLPFRMGLGGPSGDGRQWMSWIHRSDLIAMIRWLAENPLSLGVYNGTAPNPVPNAEFAATLAASLKRPAALTTPAFVLRAMLGEMADLVLLGQRVLPAHALAQGFRFHYPTLREALAEIV